MEIQFSINEFDRDGDLIQQGIYLHFGDTKVRLGKTFKEYKDFMAQLRDMEEEMASAYVAAF